MSEPPPSDTLSAHSQAPSGPGLMLLRADQRQRWQKGQRVLVESYLERQPQLRTDTEAVLDLIYNEVILREEQGETWKLEEYQKRFPHLAAQLKDLFDVHKALEETDGTVLEDVKRDAAEPASTNATMPDETILRPPAPDSPPGGPALPNVPGYEILGRLGSGTFGVVYKARHLRLKRVVALKMVREGAHAPPEEVARFRMEAESVARLQHPHIVQIYEVGDHDGLPYLALEFVEGGSLAQRLDGTPLPSRSAAELVQTLARAMHVAHQHGIVHRDLKPGNVLLAPNPNPKSEIRNPKQIPITQEENPKRENRPVSDLGNLDLGIVSDFGFRISDFSPKVTDFGLAKQLDKTSSATKSGAIMGTPSYMAPEQAAGKTSSIGPAADVYALGAILYELVTGRPPFRAETPLDTVLQVIVEEPVPPRRLHPKVPRDLETICLKCLEKEPRKRYASAELLAEDLRRFLANEPILARPTSWRERGIKWARRRPALAGLVGVIIAAVLALTGWGIIYNRQLKIYNRQLKAAYLETKDRELTARHNLYVAHLNLAQRNWNDAYVGRVLDLLEAQKPKDPEALDLRGLEWYYLKRLCHEDRMTLPGHGDVAYSPDGKFLAAGGPAYAVVVRDTARWRTVHTLPGHTDTVTSVTFNRTGQYIASASEDGTVRVWDAGTGRPWATFRGHTGTVSSVAFSPDGKLLASAGQDRIVKIWHVARRRQVNNLKTRHKKAILEVVFSPNRDDSRRPLATAGQDGTIEIWNTDISKLIRELDHGSNYSISSVAFSPDGEVLASASYDRTIKIWDAIEGLPLLTLTGHGDAVAGVAFNPAFRSKDGARRLATVAWDRTVRIWDLNGNITRADLLFTFRGHRDSVLGLAFHPGGQQLASVSADQQVKIWDVTHDPEFRTLAVHGGLATCVAFSPDGRRLASWSQRIEIQEKQQQRVLGGEIQLWDAGSGKEVRRWHGHAGTVACVAFSPDGKLLASGGSDQTVKIWNTRSGQATFTLKGHKGPVTGIAFSRDGLRLASASADKTVKVWDVATGRATHTLSAHGEAVTGVAFDPSSHLLASASADDTVKVWEAKTGAAVATLTGHSDTVNGVAFSPDGQRLVSAGDDKTMIVWDVPTWQKRLTLRGHTDPVMGLAFGRDSRRLVSLGADLTVKVWEMTTGQETLSLRVRDSQVKGVAFSPDGRRIALAGGRLTRGEVRIWDAIPEPAPRSR